MTMITTIYNSELIGKTCKVMQVGLWVKGIITNVSENEHSIMIDIDHEPVQWGDGIYTHKLHFIRKSDMWGEDTIVID